MLYILHVFFGEEAEVSGPEGFYEGGLILKVGSGRDFFGLWIGWVYLDGAGWAMITLAVGGLL